MSANFKCTVIANHFRNNAYFCDGLNILTSGSGQLSARDPGLTPLCRVNIQTQASRSSHYGSLPDLTFKGSSYDDFSQISYFVIKLLLNLYYLN